jgi:peroxiredoxin
MVMRILLSIFLCGAAFFGQRASGQLLSGRRAPSFSLPDGNQVQHDILDYRGKWLLLNFIKTSECPDCPVLSKLLEQMKKQGGAKVDVLSVLLSPPENANTAARYIVDNKLTSPVVFDQSQVAIAYYKATPAHPGIDTPHLFVINPAGALVRDWGQGALAPYLAGKSNLWGDVQALINGTAAK